MKVDTFISCNVRIVWRHKSCCQKNRGRYRRIRHVIIIQVSYRECSLPSPIQTYSKYDSLLSLEIDSCSFLFIGLKNFIPIFFLNPSVQDNIEPDYNIRIWKEISEECIVTIIIQLLIGGRVNDLLSSTEKFDLHSYK